MTDVGQGAKEAHAPARRVDPAAQAVTALESRGLLASLRSVGGTRSLFAKVSKFVAAFGARGVRNRVANFSPKTIIHKWLNKTISALLTSDFLGCFPSAKCGAGSARLFTNLRKKLRRLTVATA